MTSSTTSSTDRRPSHGPAATARAGHGRARLARKAQALEGRGRASTPTRSWTFNLTEFTTSLVAVTRRIDNTPPLSAVSNLQQLCLHVLEPLRAHLGHAVRINSGYRSPRLNAAVGGVKTSDHTRGCAADIFIPDAKTGREWFAWMMDNLEFDQLIWETASRGKTCWIHVGYWGAGRNRQQVIGHLVKR